MTIFLRLVVPFIGAMVLSACETERQPEPADVASQGVPPAIRVTTSEQRHVVYVAPGTGALSDQERGSLAAFVSDAAIGNPEAVHVRLRGTVSAAQLAAVTHTIANAGIQPSKIEFEMVPSSDLALGGGAVPGQAIEVVATVSRVDYPHCPRQSWTQIGGEDNPPSSNFGCAMVTNLEAMVADPRDLVQGESGGKTDSVLTEAAIQRLHTDKVKTLTQTQTSTAVQNSGASQ